MNVERWEKIERIFNVVVVLPPAERTEYLLVSCGGDLGLRKEIDSILTEDSMHDVFWGESAFSLVAKLLERDELLEQTDFASYKLQKLLGRGGMGAVYLAEDTRLRRLVAIKVLPPALAEDAQSVARFRREAHHASQLSHPNIAHIYEFGETGGRLFLAMEYVEGRTLRQLIKEKAVDSSLALDIAKQVAAALASTHERGIIHRDIKPENIIVKNDGLVKILDFGLAKLDEQKTETSIGEGDAPLPSQIYTHTGMILGTVGYMSPEQVRGKEIEASTDLWSLGVVLFEMLTGARPFQGDTPSDVQAAILKDEPLVLNESGGAAEINQILTKALAKNKAERYQTAGEFAEDVERVQPQTDSNIHDSHHYTAVNKAAQPSAGYRKFLVGIISFCLLFTLCILGFSYFGGTTQKITLANDVQIKSVAVLPFENQNPDTEYLSDGLIESVINNLSGLSNLRVISRNSVFLYKNKETDLTAVGRELNVGAVLTGRFSQRGDDLTINAELTDVRDNKQIWGRQYNRQTSDAFTLQQEIARDISDALRSKLTSAEQQRLARGETDSSEAFHLYLKGRYYWNKRTDEGFEKAVQFFNQALEKDPTYALAYVGLANCYLSGNFNYTNTTSKRVAMVQAAMQKALEIDDTLGEAYAVLAINKCFYEWDFAGAEREYKRAIELSPNYATAHHWYAEFLAMEGRFDESFAEYKRALELDPLSLAINTDLGLTYYYARQSDLAINHLKKLKEIDSNYARTYLYLGQIYQGENMFEDSIAAYDKYSTLSGDNSGTGDDMEMSLKRRGILENAFKTSGAKGYWKKTLEFALENENFDTVQMALIYAQLGERDRAFEFLEKAYNVRSTVLLWLKVSPEFDSLRSDSRFPDLVRRTGLPQ